MLAMPGDYSDPHFRVAGLDPFAKGVGVRKGRVCCDKHQVEFGAVQHRKSFAGVDRSNGIAVALQQHLAVRIVVSGDQKDILLLVSHAAINAKRLPKPLIPKRLHLHHLQAGNPF